MDPQVVVSEVHTKNTNMIMTVKHSLYIKTNIIYNVYPCPCG